MSGSAAQNAVPALKSVLKNDDDGERTPPGSGSVKAVQIAEPEEMPAADEGGPKRRFSAGLAKRLSGRPPVPSSAVSLQSLVGQSGLEALTGSSSAAGTPSQAAADDGGGHRRRLDHVSEKLLAQVSEWLEHEKKKKETRAQAKKHHHYHHHHHHGHGHGGSSTSHPRHVESPPESSSRGAATAPPETDDSRPAAAARPASVHSQSSEASLDRLQRIVDDAVAVLGLASAPSMSPRLHARQHPRRSRSGVGISSSALQTAPQHRGASSDTDYVDGDVVVPSCDVVLDNSRTVSYGGAGGAAASTDDLRSLAPVSSSAASVASTTSRREDKERRAWATFKNEIIRLAHTLRLKGWRRVPLDAGDAVAVERLSGALTNAVYVVSPPADLPPPTPTPSSEQQPPTTPDLATTTTTTTTTTTQQQQANTRRPDKLLLRIYGPQVSHLIDREAELGVLRRLARKKIGPRMLGTFRNGRFEQFFNAATLTPRNLRDPDTSRHIAMRMRELHDGVELLPEERDAGPGVWRNWDRWRDKVEATVTALDAQLLRWERAGRDGDAAAATAATAGGAAHDAWKSRGLVCGVEWPLFRDAVGRVRKFIDDYYGSPAALRERLVFAHNDTQYGNILRLRPDDERSPLLQPANEHKQLVVIDFEYASANTPGLEFANHFSEWMYNYHSPTAPHACDQALYPTPDEQRRFVRAYVDHRPQHPYPNISRRSSSFATDAGTETPATATPRMLAKSLSELGVVASSSSSSTTNLGHGFSIGGPALLEDEGGGDSGLVASPPSSSSRGGGDGATDDADTSRAWREAERRGEETAETKVRALLAETRLWRAANSAQWVAWGIVQAKVADVAADEEGEAVVGRGSRDETTPAAVGTAPGGEVEDAAVSKEAAQTRASEMDADAEETADEDAFDYLAYAQARALFFWGDCVLMGLVKLEELPESLRASLKIVDY